MLKIGSENDRDSKRFMEKTIDLFPDVKLVPRSTSHIAKNKFGKAFATDRLKMVWNRRSIAKMDKEVARHVDYSGK
jgi:hypothetical protein